MSQSLFFDNKKFISTKAASLLTGYSHDYIGQLARDNKIDSRRIGHSWYVGEESILNHKNFANQEIPLQNKIQPPGPENAPASPSPSLGGKISNRKTLLNREKWTLFISSLILTALVFSVSNINFSKVLKNISSIPENFLSAILVKSITPPLSYDSLATAYQNYVSPTPTISNLSSAYQNYVSPTPTPTPTLTISNLSSAYKNYISRPTPSLILPLAKGEMPKAVGVNISDLTSAFKNYIAPLKTVVKVVSPISPVVRPDITTKDLMPKISIWNGIASIWNGIASGWDSFVAMIQTNAQKLLGLHDSVPGTSTNTTVVVNSPSPAPINNITQNVYNGTRGPIGPQGQVGPQGIQGPVGESNINTSSLVTKTFFDGQVDRILDSIGNSTRGLAGSLAKEVDTKLLDVSGNATVGGALTSVGNTTLATGINTTNTFGSGTAAINTIGEATGTNAINGATTILGTTLINSTDTSATTIGNSTGVLTVASGGTSGWTNTAGNLTIATATSGTLAITSAGALNLSAGANSSNNITGTYLINSSDVLSLNTTGNAAITTGTGTATFNGDLTSVGNTTLATGINTTNTFGSGASSINTIGSVTTPGILTLNGAATIFNTSTFALNNTGVINIGTDSSEQNITFETANFDVNSTGTVTIDGTNFTYTPTGTYTVAPGSTYTVDATGTVSIDSDSTATLSGAGVNLTSDGANAITLTYADTGGTFQLTDGITRMEVADNGNVVLGDDGATTIIDGSLITLSGNTLITGTITETLTDNVADALDIQEGTNNYININTSNGSEAVQFGNATTNPSYSFLGTGLTTLNGGINVVGNGTLGTNSANTLAINSVIASDVIPEGNARDFGSDSNRWEYGYFTNIDATNISGVIVTGSTASNSWTINSDNVTNNAEIASLVFRTGTLSSINAVLQWNAANDPSKILGFDNSNLFNFPIAIYSKVNGLNQTFTSGSLFKFSQPATDPITQSGAFIGANIDFSSNLTVPDSANGNQTGFLATLKDGGAGATAIGFQTAGTLDYGLDLGGTIGTADIRLSNGETISNLVDGTILLTAATTSTGLITGQAGAAITGALTAGTFNGLTITPTAGTLTIPNNASAALVLGGNFSTTLTSTGATSVTLPTIGTLISTDQTVGQTIGATGARLTKLWATDVESTSMYTVGGTSINTAGTLNNVAYLNAANLFTNNQTITKTTEQLRLAYDASNYNAFTVGSTGSLNIAATGTNPNITLTPGGTGTTNLNGHIVLEGVTSTGATGTGKFVFDTAPTFLTSITTPSVFATANDSGALGASGTAFSDLFLASGGVINWAAGDAILTHSAGILTLDTGTLKITTPTNTTTSVVTIDGIQTLTNKTIVAGSNTISGIVNANLSGTAGITNANLANSSVTIGTTAISLGASSTTLAGLTSISSTGFTGALSGNASTATNVAVGGITGLGTDVATALGVNIGSAGAPVLFNGALGTPSGGTVTNLTGTASININGTVGATTPTTGAFTTITATGGSSTNWNTAYGWGNPSGVFLPLAGGTMTGTITSIAIANPLITAAESWIGPSSTAGVYFKGGNVGIGTTSPTSPMGYAKFLEISDATHTALVLHDTSAQAWEIANDGGELQMFYNAGWSNTGMRLLANGNAVFQGNVGIGTTVPIGKLDVLGDFSLITTVASPGITLSADRNITYYDNNGATASAKILFSQLDYGNEPGQLSFWTKPSDADGGGALGQRLTITSKGNVGIGTTNPEAPLSVAVSGGANKRELQFWQEPNSPGYGLRFYGDANDGVFKFYGLNNTVETTNPILSMNRGSGNVGIGTTNPLVKLSVYGEGSAINLGIDSYIKSSGSNLDNGSPFPLQIGTVDDGRQVQIGAWTAANAGTFSAKMVIQTTGNVGIGTTAPYKKLTISGVASQSKLDLLDLQTTDVGANTQPSMRFGTWAGNSNTLGRITFKDTGSYGGAFTVETNNTGGATDTTSEVFRIQSNGNVGIGTTAPDAKLKVVSSAVTDGGTISYAVQGISNGSITTNIGVYANAFMGTNNFGIYSAGGTNYFNGNVGIGTTNPGSILHIQQESDSLTVPQFVMGANNGQGRIGIGYAGGTASFSGKMSLYTRTGGGGSYPAQGSGWTNAVTINELGNVGIGTMAPGNKLSVNGNISLASGSYLGFTGDIAMGNNFALYGDTTSTILNRPTGGAIRFRENNGTDQVTILTGGNVGIGTTNPGSLLELQGDQSHLRLSNVTSTLSNYVNFNNGGGNSYLGLENSAGTEFGSVAYDFTIYAAASRGINLISNGVQTLRAYNGNVGIGTTNPQHLIQLLSTTGAYSDGSTWTDVSDRNMKTNFVPLDPQTALAKIIALPITQWNYKSESAGTMHIGAVAQDFYAAFGLGGASGNTSVSAMDTGGVALLGIQALNLNIDAVAGIVSTPGNVGTGTQTFVTAFFSNLFARITTWLADAGNGIASIFAKQVITDTLCVSDASGAKTCINKAQLDALLANAGKAAPASEPSTSAAGSSAAGSLQTAKTSANAKVQTDYTEASWSALVTALALPETTDIEMTAKTTAINDAIAGLVLKTSDVVATDLTAYNTALAAVTETDYTAESWTAYQAVVTVNVVTISNTEAEVNTATSAITNAQSSLVKVTQ